MHPVIKKVSNDLERMSFNTAIATLMETVNHLYQMRAKDGYASPHWAWALQALTQLIAPFAPHIAEELWGELGRTGSVHISKWPQWDDTYLVQDSVTIVVQINGKVRAQLTVVPDTPEDQIVRLARENEKIRTVLADQPIKKRIFVPGKLINFVV